MLRKIGSLVILTALALLGIAFLGYRFFFPTLPAPKKLAKIVSLDQGWTSSQREKFYRIPQGSLIVPYSWFLALEQPEPGNHNLFHDDENLTRYNLIPDQSRYNPDHLPVGIVKQFIPSEYLQQMGCGMPPCRPGGPVHQLWISYTCAACHTSRLTWHGETIVIDGSRGRWNFSTFNKTLASLLLLTRISPGAFNRFAERVIQLEGREDDPGAKAGVKKELADLLQNPAVVEGILGNLKGTYPTEEGYGRIEALGRGSNDQFAPLDKRNILLANAPVVIPPLWYTHDYDWVMSVGAIRQPLARNIIESWGANSAVDLTNADSKRRFASTIPLPHMFWMETLLSVLRPPSWPEEILGKIDSEAVKLGRYLYEEKTFDASLSPAQEQWCPDASAPDADGSQPCPNPNRPTKGLCARCHGPVAEVHPNAYGKRFWQLPLYKLDVIGTDPLDAVNFNKRQVYTGILRQEFGGREKVGIGEALLRTSSAVLTREFAHQGIVAEDQPSYTGYRQNNLRAPLAYPARTLQGYWATPPYLHNGSVPNVYELLSPASERSASFWTGDTEFDPIHLGYRTTKFAGGFEFITRRSFAGALTFSLRQVFTGRLKFQREVEGNSNLGHEFRNAPRGTRGVIGPYLSPRERLAIIEYMKVMPGLKPIDGNEELRERQQLVDEMEEQHDGPKPAGNRVASNSPP